MSVEYREPLEELAAFSWSRAPELCTDQHGCRNYHRAWSSLRALGIISATGADRDFFLEQIAACGRAGFRRILISGAADTGMLSEVAEGYRRAAVAPEIVFLDQCRTPIEQNKVLAERLGLDVDYICSDIRTAACAPVDVISTHSFLFFFEPEERPAVFRAWHRLLRPGGLVITSNRLGEGDMRRARAMPEEEIVRKVEAARRTAAESHLFPGDAADEFAAACEGMWRAATRKAVLKSEFLDLVESEGFEIVTLELRADAASGKSSFAQRAITEPRAEIVLRRL